MNIGLTTKLSRTLLPALFSLGVLASSQAAELDGYELLSQPFEVRDIPAGTPLEGHGKGAKKFGYRIPSLLVTEGGSVLAFSERRIGLHDHAQNDIVLKRSTDGGKTWGPEIVVVEDGMNSINDPLTVQLKSGRIVMMYARFPYGRHSRASGWVKMAELGYDNPALNILTFTTTSDDDGKTWSKPVDISRSVKTERTLNANTPGHMIQLEKGPNKGRIVTGLWQTIPVKQADGSMGREWLVTCAYSDDQGVTWKSTPPLKDVSGKGYPNECQVIEASNGDVVMISRNQGGEKFRKKAISKDGGITWSDIQIDPTMPSVACMGGLARGPVKANGEWDLFASFPSNAGRKNGQIALSTDHGQTWQIKKIIPGAFAYSCVFMAPDGKSLLCLYESSGYKTQSLISIPLSELVAE